MHLPELCAAGPCPDPRPDRLDGHARNAASQRELLFDILQEASSTASGPTRSSPRWSAASARPWDWPAVLLSMTPPANQLGRVAAVFENPTVRRPPRSISPAIRKSRRRSAGRPAVRIADVHDDPLFAEARRRIGAIRDISVQRPQRPRPSGQPARPHLAACSSCGPAPTTRNSPPDQVAFAQTLAQTAGRLLETEERRAGIYRRQLAAAPRSPDRLRQPRCAGPPDPGGVRAGPAICAQLQPHPAGCGRPAAHQ